MTETIAIFDNEKTTRAFCKLLQKQAWCESGHPQFKADGKTRYTKEEVIYPMADATKDGKFLTIANTGDAYWVEDPDKVGMYIVRFGSSNDSQCPLPDFFVQMTQAELQAKAKAMAPKMCRKPYTF